MRPFLQTNNKDFKKFESLYIWKQLEENRGRNLSWYLNVSLNHMPAKYLICRSIPSKFTDLKSIDEQGLWNEFTELSGEFLDKWKSIRSGESELIADKSNQQKNPSLLDLNVELVKRMLTHCNFCRWNCNIDRSQEQKETEIDSRFSNTSIKKRKHGTCQLESTSRVGSYFHHRGEELIFRGTNGSGTIFFTSCNMRCSFCQNGDISTDKENGIPITPYNLALMVWQLRMEGCHNINWVGGDPTIHLHTIVQAISILDSFKIDWINNNTKITDLNYIESVKSDKYFHSSFHYNPENAFYKKTLFNSPQLWNSNFFMSLETTNILRTLMDAWLPDFKFGPGKCALDLSRTPWYWETITGNLKLIYEWGEDFVIRHLIMPNHIECCTKPVLDWIASNMPEVQVNIMDQYHPDNLCNPMSPQFKDRFKEISRSPTNEEIKNAFQYAKELNLNFRPLSYEKISFEYMI
ncbi:MAG: radical SAM protein [Nitrososphaeraceae archaeon]